VSNSFSRLRSSREIPRAQGGKAAGAPPEGRDVPGRHRRQFLVLLSIFVAPLLAANAVYFLFPALRPAGTTNYGELVRPAQPVPALALQDGGGRLAPAGVFSGHWDLVYVGAADCLEQCRKQIFLSRQVRTALYKDAARVQRVYIAPDAQALAAARSALAADHPDLLGLADTGVAGSRAADFFHAAPGALLLVDPLGNWMMTYPPQADQVKDFKGILADMKKLLSTSQVD
jgi:hypothetical protein